MITFVYVVIAEDRHADVEATVYTTPGPAIDYAKAEARERSARWPEDLDEELNDAMRADGWLYYGRYSCEGDSIRVVERELRGPAASV